MINELRILVVDDEKYIRDLLAELLTKHDNKVETAEDGEQAFKKLSMKHFDVILTDIKMPRMDGFALLRNVKQFHPETAVVVMTAFSQDYTIREALSIGAEEYLAKPFRSEEVLMVVERAYWRSQSRQSKEEALGSI